MNKKLINKVNDILNFDNDEINNNFHVCECKEFYCCEYEDCKIKYNDGSKILKYKRS